MSATSFTPKGHKPSSWQQGVFHYQSLLWPAAMARNCSVDIERRQPEKIRALSSRAFKHLSHDAVRRMSPEQVRAAKPGHLRKCSSGRFSLMVPNLSVGSVESLVINKFHSFDDLHRIAIKLTEEQKKTMFGTLHEQLLSPKIRLSEDSLREVVNIPTHQLKLLTVLVTSSVLDCSPVGTLLMAMTRGQRKEMVPLISTSELAYALEHLALEDAKELYSALSDEGKQKAAAFLSDQKKKDLLGFQPSSSK